MTINRREFIKIQAIAAAATSAGISVPALAASTRPRGDRIASGGAARTPRVKTCSDNAGNRIASHNMETLRVEVFESVGSEGCG